MPRLLLALVACLAVLAAETATAAPSAAPLKISANAKGALRYNVSAIRVRRGRVTIVMQNPSLLPHNVAIRGRGVKKLGKVVFKGGTSTVTATLKPGRYVFYCSVAGHEAGGMKGVLAVQ